MMQRRETTATAAATAAPACAAMPPRAHPRRPRRGVAACRASALAFLGLALCACGAAAAAAAAAAGSAPSGGSGDVSDVLAPRGVDGVRVLFQGPAFEAFDRRMPEALETTLFERFEGLLNATQEFHADGKNEYLPNGRPFVVSIRDGRVTGITGSVSDNAGRAFLQFSMPGAASSVAAAGPCQRTHRRLATVVQKYGHMYYHFMQEVLPRIILLQPFLDADTKLLTFGSAHEYKWLEALGIPRDAVEVYRPDEAYCADELLVPTLSTVVTPPRENYALLRRAFDVEARIPEASRRAVVYCSRATSDDRRVANEAALLEALRAEFPDADLVTYTGSEGVAETLSLFRRARVVVGMHGACLSHAVFADVDAAVVELLFLANPPLMFWHAAAALGQRYVMVPLSRSWWLQRDVEVPVADVVDAMYLAMDAEPLTDCPPGAFPWDAADAHECLPCPAGTYRAAGGHECAACPAGRVAAVQGSGFCATCGPGTYSSDGFHCSVCSDGTTTLFPGAASPSECRPQPALRRQLDRMFDERLLVQKLVSMPGLWREARASLLDTLLQALSPAASARAAERSALQRRYLMELFSSSDGDDQEDTHGGTRNGPPAPAARGSGYGKRRMLEELSKPADGAQGHRMHRDLLQRVRGIFQ